MDFLSTIAGNDKLTASTILSSINPSIGKKFHYSDLEKKKHQILLEAKLKLIENCAKVEAARDVNTLENKLCRRLNNKPDRDKIETLIKEQKVKLKRNNDKRLQKKITFQKEIERKEQERQQELLNSVLNSSHWE